jgi:hypothetical protein
MKKTVYDITRNSDNSSVYTWPKFIMQVFGIFILLFVMVKIIQAFAD